MSKHKQLSFKEHLRKRAFYGGSAVAGEHETWSLVGPDLTQGRTQMQFIKKNMTYGEALVDNFDEILVNALDHFYRSIGESLSRGGPVTMIRIGMSKDGTLSIWNNGPGIPVLTDWPGRKEARYLPEAIISEERSGSNFDDDEDPDRVTGGMNGLGIKVSNAGSVLFEVETVDIVNGFYYRQRCRDRMDIIEDPIVIPLKDAKAKKLSKQQLQPHTVIRWKPDYDNLCKKNKRTPSVGWFEENKEAVLSIVQLRAYQTAAFISQIKYRYDREKRIEHSPLAKVFFNSQELKIKKFGDFIQMFGLRNFHIIEMESADNEIRFPWYVGIGLSDELIYECKKANKFEQMTVVNGIHATLGGSHVNLMKKKLIEGLSELSKKEISESVIDRVFCYFDLKQFPFSAFDFDSQTKNKIKIGTTDLNVMRKQYQIPTKPMKKIYEMSKSAINWLTSSKLYKEQLNASRRGKGGPIRKYDKAEKAGTKESAKCCLAVPEGDSACKTVRNMIKHKDTPVDMKYYGTYNIQGVPPNARKMIKIVENPEKQGEYIIIRSQQLRDNISLQGLVRALNLDYAHHYDFTPEGEKQFAMLHYGSILVATDQDLDGIGHICSLILVFIMCFWPNLIKRNFFKRLATPIIRVYIKNAKMDVIDFYSIKEYDEWITDKFGSESKKPSNYKTEYYKGLGGHSKDEVLSMGMKFHENVYTISWDSACEQIMEAFYGEDTDGRKNILSTPMTDEYPDSVWKTHNIGASVHFKVETKEFQLANMRRKTKSCIDGMIPTQRKSFTGGRRMFGNPKVTKAKVFQISGYVAQHMHYANGDASMNGVVMKQAQAHDGTNNIPAFVPWSDGFGDRVMGRSANAGPRYMDTYFNGKIMDMIFPRKYDWLLDYVYEDGVMCEPKYYVPRIPMALLESETTTGTGWKIDVWARDLTFTLENVRRMIKGFEPLSFKGHPWLRSDKMSCRMVNGRETCYGSYTWNPATNTITVTELPIRIWSHPYRCYLLGIDPNTNKTEKRGENGEMIPIPKKPYIVDVKDDTSNYINDIKIKLEPGAYDRILEEYGDSVSDPIESFLDLRRFMTPNLNLIDATNYVREFADYEGILKYWFPLARDILIDYLERDIILKQLLVEYHKNVLRFILADAANPKEINIDKDFTDEQRDSILSEHSYKKFNKSVLMNPRYTKADELEDLVYGPDASYEYISDITIREKKKVEIEKLRQKIDDLETELADLAISDWQSIWLTEIDEIEQKIHQGLATNWLFETKKPNFHRASKSKKSKK